MTQERLIRFCEKQIQKEKSLNGLHSPERIEAYYEMIDFVKNADKPKDSDKNKIREIFERHYVAHIRAISGTDKNIRYSFTKSDDEKIMIKLIPQIKQEIGNNPDVFGDMDVSNFFEHFMNNMPEWWKKYQFSIFAISKHFKTIYMQIINSKNGQMRFEKKATVADVVNDIQNVDFSKMAEHG